MKGRGEIRGEIDRIDDELADLFRRRMELADEVAASKRADGSPVTDPAREREIVARVAERVGLEFAGGARLLYTTLFGISKARQRLMIRGESPLATAIRDAVAKAAPFPSAAVVACPGTDGSYAQQAVSRMFGIPTILFFNGFESVFDAVEKGLCPYGILPIENSGAGSVSQVYDQMVKHSFHIVRAIRVKVDHALLGVPGAKLADVREVSSHPHALAQCGAFLRGLPGCKIGRAHV